MMLGTKNGNAAAIKTTLHSTHTRLIQIILNWRTMDWRMKMTEIRMPTDMVREIVKNADAALDAARLSFVNHKPLTSEEWRQIMQIITYTRVCCTNALRKESND